MATPEEAARELIDAALQRAAWQMQDWSAVNPYAGAGVRRADYLLFAGGKAAGVVAGVAGEAAAAAAFGDEWGVWGWW